MATREENLKKINADIEQLSDEELEQVAGGTRAETQELLANIYKKLYKTDILDGYDLDSPSANVAFKIALEERLAQFDMTVKIDVGKDGTGVGEQANEYYNSKGVKIPHASMMKIFAPKK